MLAAKGAVIIDADQISREIVEPGKPALNEIVEAFGPGVLREDGTLNRGELARLAFADKDDTKRLNAIMHPRISAESAARISAAPAGSVVVYDMPLLVETRQETAVDHVVVVDVPIEIQRHRAIADTVVDNSGSIADTQAQVDRLWASLQAE